VSGFVLDYVGIATSNLDEGAAAFRRLGFALTNRSVHTGRATGNHCAMLPEGYLEIIGMADPSVPSTFHDMLARYEGVHIVAFGCENADEAHDAIAGRQPGVAPPELLERDAEYIDPQDPSGAVQRRRAAFRNLYADGEVFPEARFLVIEHLTREVLWQPHLLEHPNGARALLEVAICTPDVATTAARLGAVLAVEPQAQGSGIIALDLDRGRIYLLEPDSVPRWAKGVEPPRVPSVVGFGVGVADLARTKAVLSERDVTFRDHPYPAIWVPPGEARGAVVSFIQI